MKIILTIPYPPSINKTYFNRVFPKGTLKNNRLKGRGLTKDAKKYKDCVAMLIHSQFNKMKFGDQTVKVSILDNPANLRGDNHNGEKIVFDSIQLSGIINNDKQIIAHEIIPGIIKNPPSWTIKIEPYTRTTKDILS